MEEHKKLFPYNGTKMASKMLKLILSELSFSSCLKQDYKQAFQRDVPLCLQHPELEEAG